MIQSATQEERFASAHIKRRASICLVLLSVLRSTDALIVPSSKRPGNTFATTRRTRTSSSTASTCSANLVASLARSELPAELDNDFSVTDEDSVSPKGAPVDRFHTDMRRVLESRAHLAAQSSSVSSQSLNGDSSSMERRERPPVLGSDIDGAERVATMLHYMVQVGLAKEESYRIVLKAFCDRGRVRWRRSDSRIVCAADEAEILMEELWPSSSDESVDSSAGTIGKPPSVETCNLAMQAYAMCATPRGNRSYATRAQELLERMDASGVQANEQTLALLVQAWAWQQANMESEDCVKRARQNLDRLIQLNPDRHVLLHAYHLVLEATSKSASNGSAHDAHALLEKMKRLRLGLEADGDSGAVLPNAQSYANAILAWCKCQEPGAAQKANDLLMEGIRQYETDPNEGSEPQLIAFNGVISAWARIGFPEKAEEVLWKLDELQSKCPNLSPDVRTYNSVLHAHVRNPSKTVALERVSAMVKYMEQHQDEQPSIKPDSFTYNTLMKVRTKREN
jgi:hypothetical protein